MSVKQRCACHPDEDRAHPGDEKRCGARPRIQLLPLWMHRKPPPKWLLVQQDACPPAAERQAKVGTHEMHCRDALTSALRTICAAAPRRRLFALAPGLLNESAPWRCIVFEDVVQLGVGLRVAAVGANAGAFPTYASSLGIDRRLLKKAASALAWVGVTAHTAYLAARWF